METLLQFSKKTVTRLDSYIARSCLTLMIFKYCPQEFYSFHTQIEAAVNLIYISHVLHFLHHFFFLFLFDHMKHKFIEKCRSGASAMVPKIEQAKQVRASMALQTQDVASDRTLPREGVFIIFHWIICVEWYNCQFTIVSHSQNVDMGKSSCNEFSETHAYLSNISFRLFQPAGDSTSEPILNTVPSKRPDGQHTPGLQAAGIKDTVKTAVEGNIPRI